MDRTIIDSLLQRARMLADYALDADQLPEGSRIFEEIDALAQAKERDGNPATAPLVAEMRKVSKTANVTIEQLVHRKTRLGQFSRQAALATPYLVGFVTLLLTLYLAFQSSELHIANMALREYQDMQSERLEEKIFHAWKMYRYERVLNAKAPVLAQLDGYQQLVDDAKRLYEKRDAVHTLLLYSSTLRYAWLVQPTVVTSEGDELTRPVLDCAEEPVPPVASDNSALFGSRIELDNYSRSIACFVKSLPIAGDYDFPMVSLIYATRNKVNLLVSWMLPGLYGLLGACVFLMRDLLLANKARGDTRIVDLLSLLLRVALGGLAGIIVGWFWVPTSPTPSSSAIDVSSISFGVAFLAGFSIDSLFAMLDRLIKSFRQSDGEKHAAASTKLDNEA